MSCDQPRLGWQHSSSRSSSNPWHSPPNLDGSPTSRDPSLNQNHPGAAGAAAGPRLPNRVADRIRAINSLQQLSSTASKTIDSTLSADPRTAPSPNLRLSPFVRRDASQTPIHPQAPFLQPKPLMSPLVHCPMPKRIQPQLPKTIEKGAMPISPDRPMCHRHGRELKPRKSAPAGMDKAFSGAYVVTGPMIRQQVDPVSPWTVGRRLAKTSGTTVSPDICPDCLAEQDILKHEFETNLGGYNSYAAPSITSSTQTERGSPLDPEQPPNVLVGTTIDNQTVNIPGATVADLPPDKFGGIVATDLGDMIDAIIVEHSGTLGRVISNIRNGMPNSDWTHNLSRELAKVSEAVASLPEDSIKGAPAFSRNINGRRSIIMDTSPEALQKRAQTMPELLDLIDAATQQFGLTRPKKEKEDPVVGHQHMPGNFPPTPGVFSSPSSATPVSLAVQPPRLSFSHDQFVSPIPSSPGSELSPKSVPPVEVRQAGEPVAIITPTIVIEPTQVDFDEDEATLVAIEPPVTVAVPPKAPNPLGSNRFEPPPSSQKQNRILKTMTMPLTKPFHAASDKMRASPARPKPSDVAKQHKQQRTFQQGWLREAATAERAERRSRSRGANRP